MRKVVLKEYMGSPVVISSDDSQLLVKCFFQIQNISEKLEIHDEQICLVNCSQDIDSANKIERIEQSKILLINDKYISKLILLFFYHGPPSLLINLDLN